MSTRGLFIFKYKGKYYVFYNGHDSYPDGPYGLGTRLIANLNRLSPEEIYKLLEQFLLLLDDKKEEYNESGETDFISIENALTRPYCYYRFFIREKEPKQNVIINDINDINWDLHDMEYVYIMNFDQELFTIKCTFYDTQIHFHLFSIPDDWYDLYNKITENSEE